MGSVTCLTLPRRGRLWGQQWKEGQAMAWRSCWTSSKMNTCLFGEKQVYTDTHTHAVNPNHTLYTWAFPEVFLGKASLLICRRDFDCLTGVWLGQGFVSAFSVTPSPGTQGIFVRDTYLEEQLWCCNGVDKSSGIHYQIDVLARYWTDLMQLHFSEQWYTKTSLFWLILWHPCKAWLPL